MNLFHIDKKAMKPRAPLGRDPRDTVGTEYPYEEIRSRFWDIIWFFFCCGWMCNLMDICYSNSTNQDRVFGERQMDHAGVDHLDSIFITSSLQKQTDYLIFLRRYFKNHDFENGTIEKRGSAATLLLDQLYKDKVSRRYRADKGTNLIAWTTLLLGTAVTIIEFVRNIVKSGHDKKSVFAIISYLEGALGLLALVTTQLTNKKIQLHAAAAACLDDLHTWFVVYFRDQQQLNKQSLFNKSKTVKSIKAQTPIKNLLLQLGYAVLDIRSTDDLYDSIATLRLSSGFNETSFTVEKNVRNYHKRQESGGSSVNDFTRHSRKYNTKLTDNSSDGSLNRTLTLSESPKFTELLEIAYIYNCPIILISEEDLTYNVIGTKGIYCQIINDSNEVSINRSRNYFSDLNQFSTQRPSRRSSSDIQLTRPHRQNSAIVKLDESIEDSPREMRLPIDTEESSSHSDELKVSEHTEVGSQQYFILYSIKPNAYQPVVAPRGYSFDEIKQQLMIFENMSLAAESSATPSLNG